MFGFIKKIFIELTAGIIRSFGESLVCNLEGLLKFISPRNQLSQARPTLIDINSNETP